MTFSVKDIPDLKGKVFIVTGANTGIGKETSLRLAEKGAHVILACRSKEKTEPVVEEIKKQTGNESIQFMQLDLSSLKSVSDFAAEFKATGLPLHVLINNAGVMMCPYSLTADGIENQFGTNHVGHHYLTLLLLDVLERSQPSRIVALSSSAHTMVNTIDFDINDQSKYSIFSAYGRSKLSNLLFARELARRLADKKIYVNAVHPGYVATDLQRHVSEGFFGSIIGWLGYKLFALTPQQGALTQLYAATHPDIEQKDIRGAYYVPIAKNATSSAAGSDAELAKKLWTFTENLLKEKLGDAYEIHE